MSLGFKTWEEETAFIFGFALSSTITALSITNLKAYFTNDGVVTIVMEDAPYVTTYGTLLSQESILSIYHAGDGMMAKEIIENITTSLGKIIRRQ